MQQALARGATQIGVWVNQMPSAIMCESQQAFDHIDAIMSVPGIHAVTQGLTPLRLG